MHKDANPPRSRPKARHKPYVAMAMHQGRTNPRVGENAQNTPIRDHRFCGPHRSFPVPYPVLIRPLPCPKFGVFQGIPECFIEGWHETAKWAKQHQKHQKRTIKPTLNWSGRRDLNPRQPAPKAGALPDCATPRKVNQAEARSEAPSAFLCISYSAMRREISPVTSFFVASTPTRIAW